MATMQIYGQQLSPFARETVTIDDTAGGVSLTSATYAPATFGPASRAYISVETAQIRFTYNGTAPTTSLGHILEAGDILIIEGIQHIGNFKAIRTGSTSATIQVTYERYRTGS